MGCSQDFFVLVRYGHLKYVSKVRHLLYNFYFNLLHCQKMLGAEPPSSPRLRGPLKNMS